MGLFDTDTSQTQRQTLTRTLPNPSDIEQNLILGGGGLSGLQAVGLGGLFGEQGALGPGLLEMTGGSAGTPGEQLFDEQYYLQNNPDVAAAVQQGIYPSGLAHYQSYGQFENRAPSPWAARYLAENPDVAAAASQGLTNPLQHYTQYGAREGRQGPRAGTPGTPAQSAYLNNVLNLTNQGIAGLQGYLNGQPLNPAQQGLINQQYDVAGQNFMRDIGDYFREQGQQRGLSTTDSPIANATAIAAARGLPQIEAARAAATQQQSNLNFQQNAGLLNFRNNLLQQSFHNRLGLGQAQTPGLGLLGTLASTRLGSAGQTSSTTGGGSTSPGVQNWLGPVLGGVGTVGTALQGLPWKDITGGIKDLFGGGGTLMNIGNTVDTSSLFPGSGGNFLGGPSDYVTAPDYVGYG